MDAAWNNLAEDFDRFNMSSRSDNQGFDDQLKIVSKAGEQLWRDAVTGKLATVQGWPFKYDALKAPPTDPAIRWSEPETLRWCAIWETAVYSGRVYSSGEHTFQEPPIGIVEYEEDGTPYTLTGPEHWHQACELSAKFCRWLASLSVKKQKIKKKRRVRNRKPEDKEKKRLTEKQTEAFHLVLELQGNITAAARRMGLTRQTVKQHYDAANKKLGSWAVKMGKTRRLSYGDAREEPQV